MLIQDLLRQKNRPLVCINEQDDLLKLARLLANQRIAATLVRDAAGAIAGIVTEKDMVRAVAQYGWGVQHHLVRDIMTRTIITVTPEQPISHAMDVMSRHHIRHLPVLIEGEMRDIISISDVVNAHLRELEFEAQQLRQYIAS